MCIRDSLTRLDSTLADPDTGAFAVAKLRERYRIALVDEFQDTDPIQWDIVRRAFGENIEDGGPTQRALVLIGDPKQAIYAFRGADVHAYLAAARVAGDQQTLATNWRSDQDLISALDAMFGGARIGDNEILYRTVEAVPAHRNRRLHGAPADVALRIRVVQRAHPAVAVTQQGKASAQSAREHVADDVAADIVRMVSSDAAIEERSPSGETTGTRTVGPGDIAVLVRKHTQATLVHDALRRVGVPAVINGAGSVFASDGAKAWQDLLQALERPTSGPRAHAAALTPFLGWTAQRVAEADDETWESVHRRLHAWARILRTRGVASLLEVITTSERLTERVLRHVDGERRMTDLRHVGQLLHEAAREGRLGVSALVSWLAGRIAEARADTSHEERSRRLESDGHAVQVLTIHRAKGLEFPVVHCPYLWDTPHVPDDAIPVYHDPTAAGGETRRVDVGGQGHPGHYDRRRAWLAEQDGEELRLAYVALTRARHQVVLWWARGHAAHESALGRLLLPGADRAPQDDDAVAALRGLAGPQTVGVASVRDITDAPWRPAGRTPAPLAAAELGRTVDPHWRRHSFSSVIAPTEDERVGTEPEHAARADEPEGPVAPLPADAEELRDVALPLADQPAGVSFGSVVHAVLQHADFTAPDLAAHLRPLVGARARHWDVPLDDPDGLAAGLAAALDTPLPGGLRLRGLTRDDRRDELAFELPLAGGERPAGDLVPAAIADLLDRRLPPEDPFAGYAQRLRDPTIGATMRGYLVGAIDLVARDPDGRFAVIDYKTNRLGAGPLTAADYRPSALAAEMHRAHYPLQALFYVVALHRYLRWRLPCYSPERHLAGAGYLFVRGMAGADAPAADGGTCGVLWWAPPPGLVVELSDLLHRGAP